MIAPRVSRGLKALRGLSGQSPDRGAGAEPLPCIPAKEVTLLSHMDKVVSRLTDPGTLLFIVGAVMVYASGFLAGKLMKNNPATGSIAVKVAGCIVAVLGMLILFDII